MVELLTAVSRRTDGPGMPTGRRKKPKDAPPPKDDCVLPTPPAAPLLNRFMVKRALFEERAIREYVEWQAKGEKVIHLEKVANGAPAREAARCLGRAHRQGAVLGHH